MIKREWLLGVGLLSGGMLSGSLPSTPAQAQNADPKIGAVGAVNTAAVGQLPGGAAAQTLFVGADVFQNQTVRTDAAGLAEIMFTDQSTITVGHGSEVVLDTFVYDPSNEIGQLAVGLSRGTMRFIGGRISKTTPVKINAPTATLTIRGGIGLFSFLPGQDGIAVFLYGDELTVTGSNGVVRTIRRPGFAVTIPANGGDPSEPFRVSDQQLVDLRGQLDNPNPAQQNGVPIDPLKPIQRFGSKDTFKPDTPLLTNDATSLSILNGTGIIDTVPSS
ncbi:MAG: hypothetical protein E6Q98_16440 [Rhodospirillaceae bacterium]|nr:MAG: hypothetical protein E6Q98_16440 [Rhodospirillaceae bacterium]